MQSSACFPSDNGGVANGELSHGLPRLITVGDRIVQASTMQPVVLRGVNRSGLEYSLPSNTGFLGNAGISKAEIEEIVCRWRARVIRLPFNQRSAIQGYGDHSGDDYLTALDTVIDWAASLGAYTILDLQWLDTTTVFGYTADGRVNHVPPLPNPDTVVLWTVLAERYRNEPAVIFDLLNEPHSRLEDDKNAVNLIDQSGEVYQSSVKVVGPNQWLPWASRLIKEIRCAGNRCLVLVSGVDWGYDLSGVKVDAENVVYSTHVYPNRLTEDWERAFGRTVSVAPVFVAEWGGGDSDLDWGARFVSYINSRNLSWTSWSWADWPHLVSNAQLADYTPTPFGLMVQRELIRS